MDQQNVQVYDKNELSMLDVAKIILQQKGAVVDFNDLLSEIVDFLELSDDVLEQEMAQFYTDLNTDGQFISLGDNHWGLRKWYPFESINEVLTQENTEEDIIPRRSQDGFDDYDGVFEELFESDDESEEETQEEAENPVEEAVQEAEDEEDLDAYREDLDELDDLEEDDELNGLELDDDELDAEDSDLDDE